MNTNLNPVITGAAHIDHAPATDASEARSTREGIAIVGMSCRLPGAQNLNQFWFNILNKVDAISEIPPERWDWQTYYSASPGEHDRITSRWGGFLAPCLFDPMDYGMPPNSVKDVEPLQLVMLEVAREALSNAGYSDTNLPHEHTAIVLGAGGGFGERGQDFVLRAALAGKFSGCRADDIVATLPEWNEDSFAGLLTSMLAGRVASRLNLGGANLTVDAACASSLAAVYMACRELEFGDADVVITGGADFCQNPFYYFCFDKTHALSPSGRCRAFDQSADGTTLGEGVVALVLKRVQDARRDGDRIYAVIKGMAASSDGRGTGLTAPHVKGQVLALERAYRRAGVSPATLGLIEAHGTGTVAGDRCEVRSLKRILEAAGAPRSSVALGSVKSMIGHTKSAAGVAGLLKAALSLHHRALPPTLGVEKPNASLASSPLYVNSKTRPWIGNSAESPRRAAVSAFGFGGTNYHAVLEEDPASTPPAALQQWPSELFLFRGATMSQTLKKASHVLAALKAGAQPSLLDLAFSVWREAPVEDDATLTIVASSLDDLSGKLDRALASLTNGTTSLNDPSGIFASVRTASHHDAVAFLFPGQGSQYPDMLSDLALHFDEVRSAFEAADAALAGLFSQPLSRFVYPPPAFDKEAEMAARKELTATNVAQPALGAAESGLIRLLKAFGVKPDMVAGHSYGEYAALCAAGCISPDELSILSEMRGRLIIECTKGDPGTMAAASGDESLVRSIAGTLENVWIANLNSQQQTIISGTQHAVAEASKALESRHIAVTPLPVACAFHSPLMAPAKEQLNLFLADIGFERPECPVFSNTTAAAYPESPEAIRAILGEHLVSPVRFVSMIEAMYEAGARVFIEAGPRTVLSGLTEQILTGRKATVLPMDARQRTGLAQLLQVLAQLATHGVHIHLDRLFTGRDPRAIPLDLLVDKSRAVLPPPTAWWVAGGRAQPVSGPIPATTCPRQQPAAVIAPEAPTQGSPQPTHGETLPPSAIVAAHTRIMEKLLDTHRRVMAAALGKGEPPQTLSGPTLPMVPATPLATPAPVPSASSLPAPPAGTPSPQPAQPPNNDFVQQEVLRIVGERTGYPPEMLDQDADLEADLGIDSIKRVEIAGRLRKIFPHLGATPETSTVGNLSNLRTLRGLIDRITPVADSLDIAVAKPPIPVSAAAPDASTHVPRFRMSREDAPLPIAMTPLTSSGVFLITDDEAGLAFAVADTLRARGSRAVVLSACSGITGASYQADFSTPKSLHELVASIRTKEGRLAGLIHLRPLRNHNQRQLDEFSLALWHQKLQDEVKSLFYLAQAAAEDLKARSPDGQSRILAAVEADDGFAGHGGIPGLINALAAEWPDVIGRTISLNSTDPQPVLVQRIVDELQADDGARYACYAGGKRQRIRIDSAELDPRTTDPIHIKPEWVILITGGACGITAQVALELAERFKPILILVGRSPAPDAEEALVTRSAQSPEELRRILAKQLASLERKPTLADIEAVYRRLCRDREMRTTLTSLRATGAQVAYRQADTRDEQTFIKTIDSVYAEFGRLDGVIHGAGVIEDKRMEDKTPESFDRVFDTKADGAFILSQHLRLDSLKFIAFFSSVAYLGNPGQSDYAAANGVLNHLALALDPRMPGRAVSIMWGPWQSAGMASEEVQNRFRARGVQVIPLAAGRRAFIDELLHGPKGHGVILLGDAPYAQGATSSACRHANQHEGPC